MLGKIRKDITGKKFGRLTVIRPDTESSRRYRWVCRCDCGNIKSIEGTKIRTGHTQSCGCLHAESIQRTLCIHGHSRWGQKKSPEYCTWVNIRSRCNNPKAAGYESYGGRGIKVCEAWNASTGFPAFLRDVGKKPSPDHSLDRIDPNGNYEKGNVRWILKSKQAQNTRRTRLITFDGQTLCVAEWERVLGFKAGTIARRIDVSGWSEHKALSTPRVDGAPAPSGMKPPEAGCVNQGAKFAPEDELTD